MVIDSNSGGYDDRGGNSSSSKSSIRKDESSPASASAKTGSSSLRRSTRGTGTKEKITSSSSAMETPPGKASNILHSSMKKSERHDKKKATPPVKRKLEALEKEKISSSPLRRSDRGKKHLAFSDSNDNGKVTAFPDVNMKKLRREKSLKDLNLEAMETSKTTKEAKRPSGQIKKTMNGHAYKVLFTQQRCREIVSDLDEELERAEKLSEDDRTSFGVSVSNPLEDGEDGIKESSEKIEEECLERHCEMGKEQSISMSNNANIHGELESSCLNSKFNSREALGEPSQENGVTALNGSMICEEIIEDSGRLKVDYASVVELQTSQVERLHDNSVEEGIGVVSLPPSLCEKDNFVETCTSCCKRRRLNNNSLVQKLCHCSIGLIDDSLKTSGLKDEVKLAECDDSHNDALNDGNLSTCANYKLDGELLPDSSRFVEYWVPVSTSNVQLEQYCATLLSNSMTLRASSSSKDIVGALHDILLSTKKCCDHPYFMDSGLQGFLTKDLPPVDYLDVGIKASGKLQLLDTVLSKIRSMGKRVLILYQSIRYAGMLTGDILDDYLRQRFGLDSYERVDGGIVPSKKQAALKKFNDKDGGGFFFLLEKRACNWSIKLSSVDAIVIFESDWNLKSDNRALQKLCIDSSPEPIKIFRLYTSCTLEEKVLELATNRVTLDSNWQSISRMACHMLLMWGASYLFSKLDEFHGGNTINSGITLCSDISMEKDVAGELLNIIIQNAENSCKNSLITKVRFTEGTYSKKAPLFGQLKVQSTDGKLVHLFWNELLERKNPHWRFLPTQSQRNRKRFQYFGDLPKKEVGESDDIAKKQKKIAKNSAVAASPRTRHREGGSLVVSSKPTSSIPFFSKNISPDSEVPLTGSDKGIKLCDLQKNLHGLLKPTISELCELLQIPEDMKTAGEIFLEYIVNNHQISSEPESILQAFQISLIWTAASLLGYNLDRKQSLDVAKQQLHFCCTEEDVTNVFTKLRPLKKTFRKSSQKFKELESKKDFSEGRLKKIQRKCKKQKIKLLRKHEEEIQEFNRIWEKERAQIENAHRAESAVIRVMYYFDSAVRLDKLKRVDDVFAKKFDKHNHEKELCLKELKGKQLDEISKEDHKADRWLKPFQENCVSVSGGKQCLNINETTDVAPSSIPITSASETVGCSVTIEIPTISSESLYGTRTMEKQLGNLCCYGDASGNNAISGNHISTGQIPDSTTSGEQETTGKNTPNELAEGARLTGTTKPDGESNKDNNVRNDVNISDSDPVENCSDAAGSYKQDGICSVQHLLRSPSMKIFEAPVQDIALLQNLAPRAECSRPSISAGILDGDATGCENTNSLEQAEDNNHPSTAEQIPDRTASGVQETVEIAPNGFARDANCSDTSKPDGKSYKDNNLSNVIFDSDPMQNCSDAAGSSRNDGILLPLVTSPSMQIIETPAQDVASLQNLAPQDACSRLSNSAAILDGDITGCGNTITLKQAEDNSHPGTVEVIPDCTTSGVQETVENSPSEFARGAKSLDNSKPDGESSKDINPRNVIIISESDPADNCSDAGGKSKNDDFCTVVLSVTSPLVHNPKAPTQDVPSPQNLATQDECSRPSISAGINDRDATGCETSTALEQAVFEHPPSAEITAHTKDGQYCENSNTLEQAVDKPLHSVVVRHPGSSSASSVMHDGYTHVNASSDVTDLIEGGPPLAHPDTELNEHLLPPAEPSPSQNGEQSVMHSVENPLSPLRTQVVDEIVNHDGTQMGIPPPTGTSVVGSETHHPSRHSQPMNLWAPPQHSHLDPLQFELELLRKATEEATKLHEDAKLHLKFEYEKELEEVVAEVCRKYEAKLQGAEAEYMLKKKELDANHNKVFMNRILAETFRTKCLEFRPPSSSRMYKVQSTNFIEHLLSLPSQPRRTPAVSSSPNFVPPAASPQRAVPSVPSLPRSSPMIESIQMRQPRTLPDARPIGNFPVSGEMRAPAPHLRPSLPTSAPSTVLTQGLPGQDPRRRPPFSAVTQVRPRQMLPVPPQQSPMQLPCQPVLHDQVPQPENMGVRNPSVPAVELPNEESAPGARSLHAQPRAPDTGLNFVGLYPSQSRVQGGDRFSGGVNLAHFSWETDVVCLSDDE